jgi:hypothetical protein
MEEKNLTDEAVVKALCEQKQFLLEEQERTGNAPDTQLVYVTGEAVFEILDLIHRLQSENETQRKIIEYQDSVEDKNAELQKQVDELKEERYYTEQDTAKEIFEKIFEVLCCFTTQGKSEDYNEGYIDCLAEVDKRLQNLAEKTYNVYRDNNTNLFKKQEAKHAK